MARIGVLLHTGLQNAIFKAESRKRLEELGTVVWNDSKEHLSVEEACTLLQGCDIAVGSWGTAGPRKAILDECPTIKLWQHAAGSVKHFFTEELKGRDLMVASCAPAIGHTVAELVVGELIIGIRRILPNSQRNRTEVRPLIPDGAYLAASTVSVIGASQVGRLLIEKLRPFGPEILLYDPFITSEAAAALGATKVDTVLELCRASHAVTMHTPLIPQTRRMLGVEEFKAMRDDCIFINASRGGCIDEHALIAELQQGRLFAFLDVSDPEPAAMDNPLRTLPNVVFTSHIAGRPSFYIGNQVVEDVQAFLHGGKPKMVVTWDMLERLA